MRHLIPLFLLATSLVAAGAPVAWGAPPWHLQTDPASGALVHIENRNDPQHMNWLREAGKWELRDWKPDANAVPLEGQWGLVETSHTGLMHTGIVRRVSERAWEAEHTSSRLTVTIRRELDPHGSLLETYTFRNTGVVDLKLPLGSVSITAPFFDQYPDAGESLTKRCHAHLWPGGSSAWVNAMRMGAAVPHLGLVVTAGSLEAYSQRGGSFNDRGVFLLHPGAMHLKPAASATFSWKLFWHQGWDDFFAKLAAEPHFVRLTAKDYVIPTGGQLEISAESASPLAGATLSANGKPIEAHIENRRLRATVPATATGDILLEARHGGRTSLLRAFVTPPVDDLIDARVKFIVRQQQHNAPGDPLDGAYVCYDNETGRQAFRASPSDHNAGRERVAMGVLGALYLPLCQDPEFKTELSASLQRYSDFISRELEGDDGVVYEEPGRKRSGRIYNAIWVAHFRLAMYRATGDEKQLDRFVRVMRAYYATEKGRQFYPIGIPLTDALATLAKAGRTADRDELFANFRAHADYFLQRGSNYPRSEVNFEQAIVGPAVQMLAEMAVATGEAKYLEGSKAQMPLLEAFAGKQPDARLNEISIRHWDDYWFGKLRVYGDTMPHYWSAINALAYAHYGAATGNAAWLARAETVVKGNLPLFTPEGTGSAACLYALTTNGVPGNRNDPLANDQDWALVNLLMLRDLAKQP